MMTMVLDIISTVPRKADSTRLQPMRRPATEPMRNIIIISKVPVKAEARQMFLSFLGENSSPTTKSRRDTPILASASISSRLVKRPLVWGPMMMPAKRYPSMAGWPSLWAMKPMKRAVIMIMAM